MDSIPNDLFEIKNRLDSFRLQRRYASQPWPSELKSDIQAIATKYPENIVRRVLKVHPERLVAKNKSNTTKSVSRAKKHSAFFTLPKSDVLQTIQASGSSNNAQCRIPLERSDGTRITLTLQSLDAVEVASLCSQFLRP